MKRIGICWSGGLDSTYLIYEALKNGHEVVAFNAVIENNVLQNEMEKKSIEELKIAFNKMFPTYFDCKNSINVSFNGTNNLHLHQPPVWLLALLHECDQKYDEFQIGYVMNDDAISYLEDIKNIYNSYAPLYGFEMPPLTFPLAKTKKEHFIPLMPKELYDLIWYCEYPNDGKPCNECVSCKRHLYSTSFLRKEEREIELKEIE